MNKIIHTKVQIADILDPLFSSREEIMNLKEDLEWQAGITTQ